MHGREGRDREGYGQFANTWCVNNMLKMVIHTYTQYIRTYMHARTHARMQAGRHAHTPVTGYCSISLLQIHTRSEVPWDERVCLYFKTRTTPFHV